jgi:hypothetical protein
MTKRSIENPAARNLTGFVSAILLVVLALSVFYVINTNNGVITGRDATHHSMYFLHFVYPEADPGQMFRHFTNADRPDYGPSLRLALLPFWLEFGTRPAAFHAVNLVVLFGFLLLIARILRRLELDSSWTLLFGLLLLGSHIGLQMFFTLNYDALYALAVMLGFYFFVLDERPLIARWPALLAIALLALLIRINTLIYLFVPFVFLLIRLKKETRGGRIGSRIASAAFEHPVWLILVMGIAGADLAYYLPKLSHLTPSQLSVNNNLNFEPGLGVTLWSLKNWTWFASRLTDAVAPAIWVVLTPIAILGWWRSFASRRVTVALFALFPALLYTLIIGTRKIEYIAPSILLFLLCATLGFAQLKRAAIKLPILALILFVGTSQFWWSLDKLSPLPMYPSQTAPNHRVRSLLSDQLIELYPGQAGSYALAGRLLDIVLPEERQGRVGCFSVDTKIGLASFAPLLENSPTRAQVVSLDRLDEPSVQELDLLLVMERTPSDFTLPENLSKRFRLVSQLDLFQSETVAVYLPHP